MSDLFAFGAARGATRLLFLGAPPVAASVARSTPRGLAAWIETGVLRGGPDPLRRLLAAVRVELDRRAEPSSPEPKLGREAHRG